MKKRLVLVVLLTAMGIGVGLSAVWAQGFLPTVVITPASLSFPDTRPGVTSEPLTFTVTKDNSYLPLAIFSVKIADNIDFQIVTDTCTGAVLDSGESCIISIAFLPSERGFFTTSMSIISLSQGVVNSAQVEGEGVAPEVTLSQSSVAFGEQTVGQAGLPRTVQVRNSGTDTLTFGTIQISGEFTLGGTCVLTLAPQETCDLVIDFVPASEGAKSGEVVLIDDAPGSPQTVSLSGTGIAPGQPDVGLSESEIDFGAHLIGIPSDPVLVTLKNTGTVNLNLQSITADGDFAQIDTCGAPAVIVPSATCALSITFTATATGARTGTVTVTDDAHDSPQTIALTGIGVQQAEPQMNLSATSVDFGSVAVGSVSPAQTVIVSNTGGSEMGDITVAISGESDAVHGFTALNRCGNIILPPGGSCDVELTYAPQETGAAAANFSVYSNAANSPLSGTLAGMGAEPAPTGGGCSLIPPRR